MDKECDIDDILSYRSFAERQLQVSAGYALLFYKCFTSFVVFSLILFYAPVFLLSSEPPLQDLLLKSKSSTSGANNIMSSQEKSQNDEQSASRARRWLNWLSLGMLGAGGTADSSSFAGVVSDEIIKVSFGSCIVCSV